MMICVVLAACGEDEPQNEREIVSPNIAPASLGPASGKVKPRSAFRLDTDARDLCLSNDLGGDGEVWAKHRAACETACREGNVYACGRLASSLETGLGGAKDLKRAQELFIKVCASRKAPHACFRSGMLHRDADEKDLARAAWNTGCKLGDAEACDALKGVFKELEKETLFLASPPPIPTSDPHDHRQAHDHTH